MKKLLLLCSLSIVLFACSSDPDPVPEAQLSVSPASVVLATANDTTLNFEITCNQTWTAQCNITSSDGTGWCRLISSSSGSKNGGVTLAVTKNTLSTTRTATLVVQTANHEPINVTVTQPTEGAYLILVSEANPQVYSGEGTFKVEFQSNKAITHAVTGGSESWLTLSSQTVTGATTSITATYKKNTTGAERTEIITLSGDGVTTITINVKQLAKARPFIRLESATSSLNFTEEAATKTVSIISSVPFAELKAIATTGNTWITPKLEKGTTDTTFVLSVTVPALPSSDPRNGVITVSGTDAEDLMIPVRQQTYTARQKDSLALVAFFYAMDGPNWLDVKRWNLNGPMNTWTGVTLNAAGRVDSLNTGKLNIIAGSTQTDLKGYFTPALINQLSELKYLQLMGTNVKFKGKIDAGFEKLTKLKHLYIYGTGIDTVKLDWSKLPDMEIMIYQAAQSLVYVMDPRISQLPKLRTMHILECPVVKGPIPVEWGDSNSKLAKIESIQIYNSNLDAELPEWPYFTNNSTIHTLSFRDNKLRGNLPVYIGTLKNIVYLGFEKNQLTGSIPASWVDLPDWNAETKDANGIPQKRLMGYFKENYLTGVIPEGLKKKEFFTDPNFGWKLVGFCSQFGDGFDNCDNN